MDRAIQDIKFLANRFKGLVDLAPKLEEISSLENWKQDYEKQVVALKNDVTNIKAEIDSLASQKAAFASELDVMQVTAKRNAEAALTKAADEANTIVNDAVSRADKLLQEGKTALALVETKKAETEALRSIVEADLVASKAELNKINTLISELKNKVMS